MTAAALEAAGLGRIEVNIPDIEEKISRLEQEISSIILSEPYTFRQILEDPEAMAEKEKQLEAEQEEYQQYEKQLREKLDQMLQTQGGHISWRMISH